MNNVTLQTPLDQIDTLPYRAYTVGSRASTKDGNEYIYLPGTTSIAKYDWCSFSTASGMSYGSVTRLAANAMGLLGIAQAAIIGDKYGWFQIKGIGWGKSGTTISSGTGLYASGTTAAVVDRPQTAGDFIVGAFAIGAGSGAATGTVKVELNYPYITNTLGI